MYRGILKTKFATQLKVPKQLLENSAACEANSLSINHEIARLFSNGRFINVFKRAHPPVALILNPSNRLSQKSLTFITRCVLC